MLLGQPKAQHRRAANTSDAYRQSQGEAWTDPRPIDLPAVVQLPPTAPFYLMFHPKRWMVMDGEVLPFLARLKRINGVNGIRHGKMKVAMADRIEEGWTIIPLDAVGGQSYCVSHACEGGRRFTTRWEQVFPGSSEIRCDREGWKGFLHALQELGIVPAHPPIYVLERMKTQALEMLETRAAKAHNNPAYTRLVNQSKAEIEALDKAISAVMASRPPSVGEDFTGEDLTDEEN